MTLAVVVVLLVLALVGALEVTRRAVAGRRMERFYDALRPADGDEIPPVRSAPRVRRPAASRPAPERRLEVPARRAS